MAYLIVVLICHHLLVLGQFHCLTYLYLIVMFLFCLYVCWFLINIRHCDYWLGIGYIGIPINLEVCSEIRPVPEKHCDSFKSFYGLLVNWSVLSLGLINFKYLGNILHAFYTALTACLGGWKQEHLCSCVHAQNYYYLQFLRVLFPLVSGNFISILWS